MSQLKAYHRPTNVDEALQLLSRPGINTAVVGGGTHITTHTPEMIDEVADLQFTDLTEVTYTGQYLVLGAMVRLQTIVDDGRAPSLLRKAARREGPNTLRHAATVGGVVTCPNKESELLAALLVFDAEIKIQSANDTKTFSLAHFLLDIPSALNGRLVTSVSLNIIGKTASARVARTPADRPIVAALARLGDDGKIRLALCGVDNMPVLVDPDNVKAAINPPHDFRGSKEYRRQMAATLTQRVMNELAPNP
jgi:CO/xanthine dehydrogenase FAD-binding subunit